MKRRIARALRRVHDRFEPEALEGIGWASIGFLLLAALFQYDLASAWSFLVASVLMATLAWSGQLADWLDS